MNFPWKKSAGKATQPVTQLVRIGYQEFTRTVKTLPAYDSLHRQIGTWAEVTVEAMFAGLARSKPHIEVVRREDIWSSSAVLLQRELDRVNSSGRFIHALFHRARTTSLDLRRHVLPSAQFGAERHDSELEEAIRWITSASSTLSSAQPGDGNFAHSQLRVAMLQVVQHQDVRDLRALEYLHTRVVNQTTTAASRGVPSDPSVKYCSSGGAGHLQEEIGGYSMRFPKPGQDDPRWDDIACFLLGAHMRAHGFADGNGRAVRCLYACTLLQGGREFVAPTAEFENQLHDL